VRQGYSFGGSTFDCLGTLPGVVFILWHPGVYLGLMILCLGMWHQLEFFCKNRVVMALQAM